MVDYFSSSSLAGVSLNTSNEDSGEKNDRQQIELFGVLNGEFVAVMVLLA